MKRAPLKEVDVAEAHRSFEYDKEKGGLIWKYRADFPKSRNTRFSGKQAGSRMTCGYTSAPIYGVSFLVHRIVWAMHHGNTWLEIDHINGVKDDNRVQNLRLATESQNRCNRIAYKNNKSGLKGVCFTKRNSKYAANISKLGVQKFLGYFNTPEEAAAAYARASVVLHREFARTN